MIINDVNYFLSTESKKVENVNDIDSLALFQLNMGKLNSYKFKLDSTSILLDSKDLLKNKIKYAYKVGLQIVLNNLSQTTEDEID